MNMHSLKAALAEKAAALGFDQCAVTTANPPASGPQLDRAFQEEGIEKNS
jgi:hypothetical protein